MQAKIKTLKAKNSSDEEYLVYPRTLIKCITNENGDNLEDTLKDFVATECESGIQAIIDGTTVVGNADRLSNTSAIGSATQPVYFNENGVPIVTTYTLGTSVPSDAKFTDTTYSVATISVAGLMSADDKSKLDSIASGANAYTLPTASSSTLGGVKTTSTVTSTSGLTACPIIGGVPYYKDTNTTYSLSNFSITATATELNVLDGITATTAELNYCDGVTSNIQTQLNGKASSSHNQSASTITAGTFGGQVVAPAGTDYTTNRIRNSVFTTSDPGVGVSVSYPNGSTIDVYE